MSQQVSNTVLMVRPNHFRFNEDTAGDNAFQQEPSNDSGVVIHQKVLEEFDNMVRLLRRVGIHVLVFEEEDEKSNPDSIFPNNWFSTHNDGSLITYPMYPESRRNERNEDVINLISEQFQIDQRYSFEQYEDDNQFLEGTGSMIFDRRDKVVYASLSQRTHIQLLDKFCLLKNYEKVTFDAVDQRGQVIYHTNVMMSIGSQMAIVGLDSITDPKQRKFVLKRLNQGGKSVIEISQDQIDQFAGNMLQLYSIEKDKHYLVMSETAKKSLTAPQIKRINDYATILPIPIPTIEKIGGGSVRCMMAEIFLNKK
ncbi:MAG TPA: arginine deiminase-related protein [Bacteroidales bacterium]|nr:arginine deiminase-related protein [Bacteroidales bacterium]